MHQLPVQIIDYEDDIPLDECLSDANLVAEVNTTPTSAIPNFFPERTAFGQIEQQLLNAKSETALAGQDHMVTPSCQSMPLNKLSPTTLLYSGSFPTLIPTSKGDPLQQLDAIVCPTLSRLFTC